MKKNLKNKILIVANLESFFMKFLIPQLNEFKKRGYEVHIAAQCQNIDIEYCDKKYDVCFARGLDVFTNIKSYKRMKEILTYENYDIIYCHTPFGAAITRYAVKKCKINAKVVYMAHGFHFFKGAPLLNWLVYYTVEKYLARYTDDIITINKEDYELANSKFKSRIHYVPGVGIDSKKYDVKLTEKEKNDLRKQLGITKDDFVMIFPAEINNNKRQEWLINTLSSTLRSNKNFHLLLPGVDSLNGKCQRLAETLNLNDQIHFLGFRMDIPHLLKISNLSVSTSKREGLPVNIMEAVYNGLPVVATDCRGNRDLIKNNKNGYIVSIDDQNGFVNSVLKVYKMNEIELNGIKKIDEQIIQEYMLENVLNNIIDICVGKK